MSHCQSMQIKSQIISNLNRLSIVLVILNNGSKSNKLNRLNHMSININSLKRTHNSKMFSKKSTKLLQMQAPKNKI